MSDAPGKKKRSGGVGGGVEGAREKKQRKKNLFLAALPVTVSSRDSGAMAS